MDYWNPRAAVASRRGETNTDDLAELVDRAVDVAPLPGDLHVGPVDLPAVTDRMPAGPSGLGQQQRESLDPAVDGGVVDLDPAFGERLGRTGASDPTTEPRERPPWSACSSATTWSCRCHPAGSRRPCLARRPSGCPSSPARPSGAATACSPRSGSGRSAAVLAGGSPSSSASRSASPR